MYSSNPRKSRRDRVVGIETTPSPLARLGELLHRGDVLLRLGMCLVAAIVMLLVTRAWQAPMQHREGQIPRRAVVASVPFEVPDEKKVEEEQNRARRQARQVYQINRCCCRNSVPNSWPVWPC